ncbi:AraC family transcriptional regulator [Paenibacillus jiagnxiensis]|uniref:AraC family transcriptional regulator n=1 Tax=Paenibacillus jiagnxiensis TaxID=3228926 RepID=UPI0033BD88BC
MTIHLHEDIHYPDASFPYAMYTITPQDVTPKGRGFNDLHWHDELQFTLVMDGRIGMRVNGIDHIMESGEAIFINKGALHITEQLRPNSHYVTFNFPEKLLAFYADSSMENHYVLPFTNSLLISLVFKQDVEWQRHIIETLRDLKKIFEMGKYWGWEYEVSLKTAQLWFIMISNVSLSAEESSKSFKKQQERMQLMVSYIHQNYTDPITLQTIAAAAHLSASECNRSFKRTINMTAYDYLIHYRIKRSCELLMTTDYTITEVARMVGFNHVNHFIQSFKKHYGITPMKYRKRVEP